MTDVIRDLPVDDRPRERLFKHGVRTLSDTELVAILLGCGTLGTNALELARELLRGGGIKSLASRDPAQVARLYGMGEAKAARISAAFEIARRFTPQKLPQRSKFELEAVGADLVRELAQFRQERLGAFFLDARGKIVSRREIFIGTVNHAAVSTRDILRTAVEETGVAVALYHNHPSGDPTPSSDDITFTTKINEALALADIELIDHLVVGAHRFVSMKRKGIF